MTAAASGLVDPAIVSVVEGILSPDVGERRPLVPELLARLHETGGLLGPGREERRDLRSLVRMLASIAWSDMTLAFSLWCHRVVIEYFRAAGDVPVARRWLPPLEAATVCGSTALAAAMAHHVAGAPLPLDGQETAAGLRVDGRVRWASNLFAGRFVLVTAVARRGAGPAIVAVPADREGVEIDPWPELLDLQGTSSSSLRLSGVRVGTDDVLSTDFASFVSRIRPLFLLSQAAFCWGLAARALAEGRTHVSRGTNEVFGTNVRALEVERDRLGAAIGGGIDAVAAGPERRAALDTRSVVDIRLHAARLAEAATRLESKLVGGAGYARHSATARRLREAAFLPVQSPTEGQLLWELSRSH